MTQICPKKGCKNKATISPKFGVMPCQACQSKPSVRLVRGPEFYSRTQTERINDQREDPQGSTDMLQPWQNGWQPNPDFIKAYPEQVNQYFTKEELKKADL